MKIHPKAITLVVLLGLFGLSGLTEISCTSAAAKETKKHLQVRAATFNIYNRLWDRRARMPVTLQVLKNIRPDILGLQEVSSGLIAPGNPAEFFANHLKMHAKIFWHQRNLGLVKTGVAILSRWPILETEYHDFKDHQFLDVKGFMLAKINAPSGILNVINVHLASTENATIKASEFRQLGDFVKGLGSQYPTLILGDFNEDISRPVFQEFIKETKSDPLYKHLRAEAFHNTWSPSLLDACSHSPGERIDYLFIVQKESLQPLSFQGGQIVVPETTPHPSDHCAVYADLNWQEGT